MLFIRFRHLKRCKRSVSFEVVILWIHCFSISNLIYLRFFIPLNMSVLCLLLPTYCILIASLEWLSQSWNKFRSYFNILEIILSSSYFKEILIFENANYKSATKIRTWKRSEIHHLLKNKVVGITKSYIQPTWREILY